MSRRFPINLLLLGCLIIASCNFFKKEESLDQSKFTCFLATSNLDTAILSVDTSRNKFKGLFTVNYNGGRKHKGNVEGVIKGDTLKGHFDFKVNNVEKWYRNPVAFIRKGDQLTMGVGQFVMVWGSPHFDPKVPIDYSKGRFTFSRVACK